MIYLHKSYSTFCLTILVVGLVSVFKIRTFPSYFLVKSIFICYYNTIPRIHQAVSWDLIPPAHPSYIRMSSRKEPEEEGGSDSDRVGLRMWGWGCQGIYVVTFHPSELWCLMLLLCHQDHFQTVIKKCSLTVWKLSSNLFIILGVPTGVPRGPKNKLL